MRADREPGVGVALSGGGAAGMAHVGVLEALAEGGVPIRFVAGTSFGAVVGAAFAAGRLTQFRDIMCGLTRRQTWRLFDPIWPQSGLLEGRRCLELVRHCLGERIEDLPTPFAAVAADLHSGERVSLRTGPVVDAVRASMAIPGLLTPQRWGSRVLVDGGLVDPIPVAAVRELGAEFVIAVSVLRLPATRARETAHENGLAGRLRDRLLTRPMRGRGEWDRRAAEATLGEPEGRDCDLGLIDVLTRSSALIQSQVAGARLREDPPDRLIRLPAFPLGLFDFHRATEVVATGRAVGRTALPGIVRALNARRAASSSWLEMAPGRS